MNKDRAQQGDVGLRMNAFPPGRPRSERQSDLEHWTNETAIESGQGKKGKSMVGSRMGRGLGLGRRLPSAVVLPGRQPQKRHKCYAGAKSSGAVEGGCLGPEGEHVPITGRTEDAEGVAAIIMIMAKRHQPGGGDEARCQKWAGGGFS